MPGDDMRDGKPAGEPVSSRLQDATPGSAVVLVLMLGFAGGLLLPSEAGWSWRAVAAEGLLLASLLLCLFFLGRLAMVFLREARK